LVYDHHEVNVPMATPTVVRITDLPSSAMTAK
jgi:hypothetical protein